MKIDSDRLKTIQMIVKNYYNQVKIIERARKSKYLADMVNHPTDITLKQYLELFNFFVIIKLSDEEIEYGLTYALVIPKEEKTIFM